MRALLLSYMRCGPTAQTNTIDACATYCEKSTGARNIKQSYGFKDS